MSEIAVRPPAVPAEEIEVVPVPVAKRVKACRITQSDECKIGMWEWQIEMSDSSSEWVSDKDCAEEKIVAKFCKTNNIKTIYIIAPDYTTSRNMIEIHKTVLTHLLNCEDATYPKIRNGERTRVRIETYTPSFLDLPTILVQKLRTVVNVGDEIRFTSFDCLASSGKTTLHIVRSFESLGVNLIYVPLGQNSLMSSKTSQKTFFPEFRKYFAENLKGGYVGQEFPVGTVPFGYVVERTNGKRKLVAEPEEIVLVQYIVSLYATGKHTFESIAKFLNEKNHRKRGELWTSGRVLGVIRSVGEHGFAH